MIEKGKISPMQLAIIMHPTIISTAALSVPSITTLTAGIDMWMTPMIASLVGLLTVYIVYRLCLKFPDLTFVQYSQAILGSYAGKAIAIFFSGALIYTNGLVLREYGEFVIGDFLQETPMLFVIACMVAVSGYAVYAGLEVLSRASQILIPAAVLIIFSMVVLMSPGFQVKQMFPILGNGLLPPLLGSIVPSSWFSQFFILSYLLPYVNNRNTVLKWSFISVALVMITLLAINLSVLFMFGTLTQGFNYAFLIAVRYISIADFLEHVESLLMAIWLIGIFIKVALIYYATVLGIAQLAGLANYRPLIVPVGVLTILLSIWVAPNFQELKHILGTSLPFFSLLVQLILPSLLLIAVSVKGAFKR
ncbi:endospore germination permease [Paenibacillus alba]|uniref:GerAB/ArcD/ProY family transporter n=1 Tax=Paenibacillus alba TaxID=1197127 RepID=UPI0015669C78|nr:endospore germination permease [Paenibacillus alba]NQX68930.1 endospore germination permease [Paenibacillus alba]